MLLCTAVCNTLQQPNDGKLLTDCNSSKACLESFFGRVHIKRVIPRAFNVATPVQRLKRLNLLFCQWPHKRLQETRWCQKLGKNNKAAAQNEQTRSSLCLTYSQIRQLRKQPMPELWEDSGSAGPAPGWGGDTTVAAHNAPALISICAWLFLWLCA